MADKTHTVTKYEILSLMPAPPGIEAVFGEVGKKEETLAYDVMAFAVAKVTSQVFGTDGRAVGEIKQQPNEVVGLIAPHEEDGEPTYAHDMIAEETSNFRGYRRKKK